MRRLLLVASTVGSLLPVIASGQIGNIVVTSAAGFQPDLPPRGSIGTIFCTGLKVSGIVGATGTPLPTSLAGVTVTVGGVTAPLFAVADLGAYQQVNFQVPIEIPASQAAEGAQIVMSQNGTRGSTTPILLVRKICGGPTTGCTFPTFRISQPVLIPAR